MMGELEQKSILLFDGYCNLCSGAVKFVLEKERDHEIYFAPLSSETGQRLTESPEIEEDPGDTIVYLEGGEQYKRSAAVAKVLQHLKFPYPLLGKILMYVPDFLADRCYDLVAGHRYRLFGRKDTCMAPSPEFRDRFLD